MKLHKHFSVVLSVALLLSAWSALPMSVANAAGVANVAADKHPGSPPNFGPNVLIFDPGMSTSQIQAAVDAVSAQQVDNEMGPQRYALLFKPGVYGSVAARRHHQRPYRRL